VLAAQQALELTWKVIFLIHPAERMEGQEKGKTKCEDKEVFGKNGGNNRAPNAPERVREARITGSFLD